MLDIARSKYINAESASVKAHVFFFTQIHAGPPEGVKLFIILQH